VAKKKTTGEKAATKKKATKKEATKKKATKKKATKKKATKKEAVEPGSRGLTAPEVLGASRPAEVERLAGLIEEDGGVVVGAYRDPLGGRWQLLAVLPLEKVAPTPFQRDISATHVKRLGEAIDRLDRYLDPVVAVRTEEGVYWTPNGHHRLQAVQGLGAKAIAALVVPEVSVAFQILALNTEKAHNLKEKSLEVIRMARALADLDPSEPEERYAAEFEEPGLLTLGACYERTARFAGSTYNPVLKRVEAFSAEPLPAAIAERERRAGRLLEVDALVSEAVAALKERGFDSPYLKTFVVARINPVRGKRGKAGEFDEVIEAMLEKAQAFDPGAIDPGSIGGGGPPAEE